MSESDPHNIAQKVFRRTLEISIRLGLIALLLIWCFEIASPFLHVVMWGIIIVVATHPIHEKLLARLGGKHAVSAVVITLAIICKSVPARPPPHIYDIYGFAPVSMAIPGRRYIITPERRKRKNTKTI